MGSQKNEEKEYVVDSQHDERLSGLPSLKGNEEQHECQKVSKGVMNGTTHVGENSIGFTVPMMQMEVWVLQSRE